MDDEAILIILQLQGFIVAQRQMRALAAQVRALASPWAQMQRQATAATNTATAAIRRQTAAIANQANVTQRMVRQARGPIGPAQRVQQAQMGLRAAQASGNPLQVFDAQYRVHQANAAAQRAQKAMNPVAPSFAKRLMGVISSSRFSMGGGGMQIMPLIGRTLALLGPEVAAVATVAAAAATAIAALAVHAAEAGAAFAKLGLTAGGTGAQTGHLSVMGNALGVDMGQMARQFADAIAQGGPAAGFASRAGIHDYGTFDTTNKAGKFLDWIDHLRKLSPTEAMRAARATGTESVLPLRSLSDRTMGNLRQDAGLKSEIMSPEFQKNAIEMQVSIARVGDAFGNLVNAIIKPILPYLAVLTNQFANFVNGLAKWANENKAIVEGLWAAVTLLPMIGKYWKEFSSYFQITGIGLLFRAAGAEMKFFFAILEPFGEVIKNIANSISPVIKSLLDLSDMSLAEFDKAVQATALGIRSMVEMLLGQKDKAAADWKESIRIKNEPLEQWKKENGLKKALEDNTRSLDENTAYARGGTYGGGPNARGAVPSKWSGMNTDRYIGEAARLGAFAL